MKRVCRKCGEEKDIELFVKNKACKEGHTYRCNVCCKKEYKVYIGINEEKFKKLRLKYYKENATRIKENKKIYNKMRYLANPQAKRDKTKHYYYKERELVLSKAKKYRKENKLQMAIYRDIYSLLNKDYLNEKYKCYHRMNRKKLKDIYVIKQLCSRSPLKFSDIRQNPKLIELKRQQIKLKRKTHEKQQQFKAIRSR